MATSSSRETLNAEFVRDRTENFDYFAASMENHRRNREAISASTATHRRRPHDAGPRTRLSIGPWAVRALARHDNAMTLIHLALLTGIRPQSTGLNPLLGQTMCRRV